MTLRSITVSLTDLFTITTTILIPLCFFRMDYCWYLKLYSDSVQVAIGEKNHKLAMVFKKRNLYGVWTSHMVQSSAAPSTREVARFNKDRCDLACDLAYWVNRKCFRLISDFLTPPPPRIGRRAPTALWQVKRALSFRRFRFDHGLVH